MNLVTDDSTPVEREAPAPKMIPPELLLEFAKHAPPMPRSFKLSERSELERAVHRDTTESERFDAQVRLIEFETRIQFEWPWHWAANVLAAGPLRFSPVALPNGGMRR